MRLLARNPEANAVRRVREGAGQNAGAQHPLERLGRVRARRKAEKARPAENAPAGARQQRVEPRRLELEPRRRRFRPGEVAER